MQSISLTDGLTIALDAILNDRLVVLAGAGLSMAPPSSLPSAATVAKEAKQKYSAQYGTSRVPLPDAVEAQAQFFFDRDELATVYFKNYIDQHAFAGPPNPGHYSIADLLLVSGILTAVTTNVDTLVETAGQMLFGQIGVGIDLPTVAQLSPNTSPLLKIHGCRVIDFANMIWAPGQLSNEPNKTRIAENADWLSHRLLDRDLLIVGYWTDWDYLNGALASALGKVSVSKVVVVDLADSSTFQAKGPTLHALGSAAPGGFKHVQASGADFLDQLRGEFSRAYIRQVLHQGIGDYKDQTGDEPDPMHLEPADSDTPTLWQIRRDLQGCGPKEPATQRAPSQEPLVGLTLLQLRAAGAVPDGQYWNLSGKRIRAVKASNKPLHKVQATFERETAPTIAPEYVIAIGAESQTLPANIARVGGKATIARGSKIRWLTRADAVSEFSL